MSKNSNTLEDILIKKIMEGESLDFHDIQDLFISIELFLFKYPGTYEDIPEKYIELLSYLKNKIKDKKPRDDMPEFRTFQDKLEFIKEYMWKLIQNPLDGVFEIKESEKYQYSRALEYICYSYFNFPRPMIFINGISWAKVTEKDAIERLSEAGDILDSIFSDEDKSEFAEKIKYISSLMIDF